MEQNTRLTEIKDPYFDEIQAKTKFSFDFVLWFYRILKYWYLFVISLILFLGYAYIKNKSWTPRYLTSAFLMIEPRFTNIGVAAGAVPLNNIIKGIANQQMALTSYDMIARTINKLPQLQVDYFRSSKFRRENLYGSTPVIIECNYVAPSAYNHVFSIEPVNTEKCKIYYNETENTPAFSMEIPYNEFVPESRFFIRIKKTDRFTPNFQPFKFRFVSKEELIARYSSGKISSHLRSEGSSVLVVSVTGDNSIQDTDFLNALLSEFEAYNLSLKNEAAENTIKFIDKQLFIISDSLNLSESVFKDFQERTGIYKIESGDNRLKLDQIHGDLGTNKAKESAILKLTEMINNTILSDEELVDPSTLGIEGIIAGGSLSQYIDKYNDKIKKMSEMGKANPLYTRNEKELLDIKMSILNGLKNISTQIQTEKESLEQEAQELEGSISTLPAQEREFLRYERNYKVNESYQTYLMQKKYEANIQKASNVPDNYILEKPRQRGGATNTGEKEQTYMMFLAIALALPLGFVICKEELFNYSISTKEECEKISGLPVIGTLENISKKMSQGGAILVKNFPKSSFAESFRNMRIRIEYITQRESPVSILVTSAEPGDGKTFVAANMASIYQLTGKKVVLLDFDLRRPSVGKNLGVHSKKGVSNYLIGQVSLDEIVLTHPEYGFDIITAGTLPPNPSELIKTKKTRDLIEYLKSTYDFVVLDCSPIGLVSDAYILSRYVDTTLFVVRRGKTNKAFFKSVVSQVRDDGLGRFALVFNDVKGREGFYGTSRYYGDKSYYLKRNSYYHDDYFEK